MKTKSVVGSMIWEGKHNSKIDDLCVSF